MLLAACEDPPPPDWKSFTVTAKPLGEAKSYGEVLRVEFTVRNGHDAAVYVDRIEATAGRRHEMTALSRREMASIDGKKVRAFTHSGLLLPGQELTFVMPWRVIAGEDKLILTITPVDVDDVAGKAMRPDGKGGWSVADEAALKTQGKVLYRKPPPRPEPILAGAILSLPAPVAPFDPKWSKNVRDRPEAWTFSPTLGGYVVRVRAGSYNLQREDEVVPLPPTPFTFFDDLDGAAPTVKLLRLSGDVVTVTTENVRQILQEILRAGRQISFSDDRARAHFEEKPW